jgi:hypothetical protein
MSLLPPLPGTQVLDPTLPVYSPTPGWPVEAEWGVQTSEHVLQRFTDIADRNARWPNPPHGAHAVTLDTDTIWYRTATAWVGAVWIGLCAYDDLSNACGSGLCLYDDLSSSCIAGVATGATAGTPGTWTPTGTQVPANYAAANSMLIVATPATAWTLGQYMQGAMAGAAGEMYYDGAAWVAGRAP